MRLARIQDCHWQESRLRRIVSHYSTGVASPGRTLATAHATTQIDRLLASFSDSARSRAHWRYSGGSMSVDLGRLVLFACLVLLLPFTASAQEAALIGTVSDTTGAV